MLNDFPWKGTEIILSFWDCTHVLHFRLFCWLWGLLFYGTLAHSCGCNGHLNLISLFPSILVHWFLKCWCSLLPSPVWPCPVYLNSWTEHSKFLSNIVLHSIRLHFHHQTHPQLSVFSALAQPLHSFWSYISTLLQWHVGYLIDLQGSSSSIISFCLFILFMVFSRQECWR